MKKVYWTIALLIILMAVFFLSQSWREKNHFKSDYVLLEKEILEKDSTGKGYSDVVEEKITKLITDSDLRHSLRQLSKFTREELRAKTQDEYTQLSIKSLQQMECVRYASRKLGVETDATIKLPFDNSQMYDYYDYLNQIRFASRDSKKEITKWINDKSNYVKTQEDYEAHCR